MARQTWDPDADAIEPLPVVKRRSKPLPPTRQWPKAVAALVVAVLGAMAVGWVVLDHGIQPAQISDFLGHRWKDESADHFTFAAGSDFGGENNADSIAAAARARASGASFLIALGDFGSPDDSDWCHDVNRYIPELAVVAGDFEDQSGPAAEGSGIASSCPYTLPSPYVPANGTAGYGFEYYFDYPPARPLARFIMLSPGLKGKISYNYSKDSPHTEWMEGVVDDARDHHIPWVIVGVHNQCITVGVKHDCPMGQQIFDELIEEKVDMILVGHAKVYERSKPLRRSDSCDSIYATDQFEPSCVVPQEFPNAYEKGKGTVVVVQGVGGRALDDVTIDGSDPEIGYFNEVMGRNANTETRLPGFGSVFYKITRDSITAETDFCPPGQVGSDGACEVGPDAVFMDRFAVSEHPSEPVLSPRISPMDGMGFPVAVSATDAPRTEGFSAALLGPLFSGGTARRFP